MRIGLDATRIFLPTGEGTYTREIIRHLLALGTDDTFLILIPEKVEEFAGPNVTQHHYPEVDGILQRLRYTNSVHPILRTEKVDVFHNLTNYGIVNSPCPVVTTVHDLLTLRFPQLRSTRLHWLLYRYFLPYLLRKARCIAAISDTTRSDLEEFYGLVDTVEVVHNGYNAEVFHPRTEKTDTQVLSKYGLDDDYLLFVGYVTPKKNVEVLLRAMNHLQQEQLTPRLVLAGDWGYGSEPTRNLISELDLESQVVATGFIAVEEIAALYRHCSLFLFPSIFEGFGLPALEAMASGVPVLVSSTGPLPEIVGRPEYTCVPDRPDLWAEMIAIFLNKPEHADQARLWSLERAQSFSWAKAARELRAIYGQISESPLEDRA